VIKDVQTSSFAVAKRLRNASCLSAAI